MSARLRSMIWYWLVVRIAKVDDNELERRHVRRDPQGRLRFAPDQRSRTFEQIRKHGVNPDWQDNSGNNSRRTFSLVEILEKKYPEAYAAFKSPFWILVSNKAPTRAEIAAVIDVLKRKLKLFRASSSLPLEAPDDVYRTNAFKPYPKPEYAASLEKLASSATLDHVALFAALYLEAINETALDQAIEIRRILGIAVEECIRTLELPDLAKELLRVLVDDRVIKRRWGIRPTPEERRLVREAIKKYRPSTHRGSPITAFMIDSYYLLLYPRNFSPLPMRYPMVRTTKALESYKELSRQIKRQKKVRMEAYWGREWSDQPTSSVPGPMLDFEVNGTSDGSPGWMREWGC